MKWVAAAAFLLFAGQAAAASPPDRGAPARPARIMSLKICTDELLLDLVPPSETSRIVAITFLSREKAALKYWPQAAGIPINHGSAEEILDLHPDLILTDPFTAPALRAAAGENRRAGDAKCRRRRISTRSAPSPDGGQGGGRGSARRGIDRADGCGPARAGGASSQENAHRRGLGHRRLCAGQRRAVRCHADGGRRAAMSSAAPSAITMSKA